MRYIGISTNKRRTIQTLSKIIRSDAKILEKATLIKRKDPALISYLYRKQNNKNKAIETLRPGLCKSRLAYGYELLSLCYYFNDLERALQEADCLKFHNLDIEGFRVLIEAEMSLANPSLSCKSKEYTRMVKMMLDCMRNKFNANLFKMFFYYIRRCCGHNTCVLLGGYQLKQLFTEKYLNKLGLHDLKKLYLKFRMPEVLKRLVRIGIGAKYVKKYFKVFGVRKEDVLEIIEERYCEYTYALAKRRRYNTPLADTIARKSVMKSRIKQR